MTQDRDFYTAQNIACWNEAAPRHEVINESLNIEIATPEFNNLNPDFDRLVDSAEITGKSVVQICCNNGIDLISIKNKGAGQCLGIDGSIAFIEQARRFAKIANLADINFVQSDIYQLPDDYQSAFDVAVITVGVFGWMPDLQQFMQVCASLLRDGGTLLVEELHPVLGMYEEGKPSYIDSSYFNNTPFIDSNGLDYFNYEKYDATENYFFHHSIDEILMSAINSGLSLQHIKELPYNVGNFCADLEFTDHNPPLGINLRWRKAIL